MTLFFDIAGVRLALWNKEGNAPAAPESYRPFTGGPGEAEIAFEWRSEPDESLWAALQARRPLFSLRRWSMYEMDSELVFVAPPSPPARSMHIVTLSKSAEAGRVYLLEEPGLLPFGVLTFAVMEYILAQREGVLVHGSAVEMGGGGWLFVGDSGWGKSHWARRMEEQGATVLGDDRVILRERAGCVRVFGTPWNSDPRWCAPGGAPLERIFFLRQAEADSVQAARPAAGAALLLRACLVPAYDRQAVQVALQVASRAALQARPFLLGYATSAPDAQRLMEL